jgi:hypothetical protein
MKIIIIHSKKLINILNGNVMIAPMMIMMVNVRNRCVCLMPYKQGRNKICRIDFTLNSAKKIMPEKIQLQPRLDQPITMLRINC